MNNQSDEIFLLQGTTLQPLPVQTMRAGLFGKSLEDALQTILQKYPKVIPGKQIDPVSEDPPRFVLLRREMPVAGWSLDHLYVDQRGTLTLVETKLIQNPESRREVIGQIIEYAASAMGFWGSGRARQQAGEFWAKQGGDLDEALRGEFGDDLDIEEFWNNIEANLRAGRIRLIIAADQLRPEVRRMIEYLNGEMQNSEILGPELKCYGNDTSSMVLVPQLVGQTQGSIGRRVSNSTSDVVLWTSEDLRTAYLQIQDTQLSRRLQDILDWSLAQGVFMDAHAKFPTFGIRGPNNMRILTIGSNGGVYLFIDKKNWNGSLLQRDELVEDLKYLKLLNQNFNSEEIVSGRNLNVKITELSEEVLSKLLDILPKYCRTNSN